MWRVSRGAGRVARCPLTGRAALGRMLQPSVRCLHNSRGNGRQRGGILFEEGRRGGAEEDGAGGTRGRLCTLPMDRACIIRVDASTQREMPAKQGQRQEGQRDWVSAQEGRRGRGKRGGAGGGRGRGARSQ